MDVIKKDNTGNSALDKLLNVATGQAQPTVNFTHDFDMMQVLGIGMVVLVVGLLLILAKKRLA